MNTKEQINNTVYKLRDSLGDKDPWKCPVTGAGWNNDAHNELVGNLLTIRRLAKKHHRLAEMDCNGEGYIRGQRFYAGMSYGEKPDAYEVREYGYGVKSAYLSKDAEETVFDLESEKVSDKINVLVGKLGEGWRVEFQGDPRGNTVKLFYSERYIDINF